jgi:hypothetical protein
MSKIEVTPRRILGYIMIALGLILWSIVIVSGLLLVMGILQPIRVPNVGYGIDVVVGIVLQLGVYAILVGIGFGLAKNGVDLVKD